MKALTAAVLVAALACGCGSSEEEIKAPLRVKFAHVMLEKEKIEPELDADSARKIVFDRKLRERMIELERQELAEVMSNTTFKSAIRVTLLKKRKIDK